jgi:DNA-binding beta-propeller fold protein YncE
MTRRILFTAALILALGQTCSVSSAETSAETLHSVYITSQGNHMLTVIDNRSDQVVGKVDLGLIPTQIEVSSALPRLIAMDGVASGFALADLEAHQTRQIPTGFPVRRLFLSEDNLKAGVSDLAGGHLAIFDLSDGRRIVNFSGLPAIRDVIFANEGNTLIVAADGLTGLGRIDAATGKLTADIPTTHPLVGGVVAFTRSPNGRQAFARGENNGPIEVVDIKTRQSLAEIEVGRGPLRATPSGTGAYLLVANATESTLSIVHGEDFKLGAILPAMAGPTIAYSGWFDSVAFLSSADKPSLLVFDLWRLSKGDEIALPAKPGPGTVTPDGAKLYLPLAGSKQVAIIDIRYRRLATLISMDAPPNTAVVAGGYGICH